MTPPAGAWNEAGQSEAPAIALLEKLGYSYVPPETVDAERDGLRGVVLVARLGAALRRLNPWLSDDNLHKAVRAITSVQATSPIEANEVLHTVLTFGIALEQDLGAGRRNQQVRFLDFDTPANNDFIVTRQFTVKGARKHIIPDVVCFANGIPLAIIEAKSPTLGDGWKHEALDQFDRYQELSDKYAELGAPRLFYTMQFQIATCGQDAVYGTVGTPARFYLRWKRAHPRTETEVAKLAGKESPSPQDITVAGLLAPANLLDIVRNFVVFERDLSSGRVIRKVPRYQQFGAVNKAVARAARRGAPEERGGVVWATQGSGKSLTGARRAGQGRARPHGAEFPPWGRRGERSERRLDAPGVLLKNRFRSDALLTPERRTCQVDRPRPLQRENRRARQEAHQFLRCLRFGPPRGDVLGHEGVVGRGPEQAPVSGPPERHF